MTKTFYHSNGYTRITYYPKSEIVVKPETKRTTDWLFVAGMATMGLLAIAHFVTVI